MPDRGVGGAGVRGRGAENYAQGLCRSLRRGFLRRRVHREENEERLRPGASERGDRDSMDRAAQGVHQFPW